MLNVWKEKKEEGVLFFLLAILGPFFLALSLVVAHLYQGISLDLWIVVFASFFLLLKYPEKGSRLAFSAIICLAFFRYSFLSKSPLWELGLQSSFFLAFFVTKLCLGQIKTEVGILEKRAEESLSFLKEKEETFIQKQKEWEKQELFFLEKEKALREQLAKKREEYKLLEELKDTLKRSHALFLEENTELLLEIGKERREKRLLVKEKQKTFPFKEEKGLEEAEPIVTAEENQEFSKREEELKALLQTQNKELEFLRRIYASYEQLKKQFQEKKRILQEAKKEIFSLEGKLLFQKKQEEENSLEKQGLSEELLFAFSLQEQYEEEILLLQEFFKEQF